MHERVLEERRWLPAPPERVWAIFLDATRWPEWCGPVRRVVRVPATWSPGERLGFVLRMGLVPVHFEVTLEEVVPERRIRWASTKWWGVRGERTWTLEPADGGGTWVTDTKRFTSSWWPLERVYPTRSVQRMSRRWLADLATAASP